MLRQAILTLGLCSLGRGSPVLPRDTISNSHLSASLGFNLIVNLTDPSKDFDPPIHSSFVTTIHVGAGLAKIGTSAEKGPVFFQNGTEAVHAANRSTIVTLSGTPPTAAGFKIKPDNDPPGFTTGNLDFGPGTPGLILDDEPVVYLEPGTFFACDEPLEYYQGKRFVVIKHSGSGLDVPKECRAVQLVPQCAALAPLPGNAYTNYDFALNSPCYDDVEGIDWNDYSDD